MRPQTPVQGQYRGWRCVQCGGPVPLVVSPSAPRLSMWQPVVKCHECVIKSGDVGPEQVRAEFASLAPIKRLLWIDDPARRPPDLTMMIFMGAYPVFPGSESFPHLQVVVAGVAVDIALESIVDTHLPMWRGAEGDVLFAFMQVASNVHNVRARRVVNLVSGHIQCDLLNVECSRADDREQMLVALALLNAHYDGRGTGTGSGLALSRGQVEDAIRAVIPKRQKPTQDEVRVYLWPNDDGLQDRQFRTRCKELFDGRRWGAIVDEAVASRRDS